MRDPVLERDMFRKAEATPSSDGVVSLVKGESDYERRKKQAMEMLAAAKERQNPENYKTLSEQSRPGVFRPVATGQPQAPQPNTQQQMAQMQAMGFRPVGMADGGYVQRFAQGSGPQGVMPTIPVGPNALYTMPDVGLRIGQTGTSAIDYGPTARDLSPAREAPEARSPEGTTYMKPPATWSDEDIERMADQFLTVESGRYKESTAKTPIGRGLQSLNPFRREPNRESIVQDLKQQRDIARRYTEEEAGAKEEQKREEQRGEVVKSIPKILEPSTPEEYQKSREEYQKSIEGTVNPRAETPGSPAPEGINSLAGFARARAAARDVYEAPAKSGAAPTKPTPEAAVAPQGIATTLNDIKRQRETDRQDDVNMALLQAGLAMAAGESPNALKNIAAGGISGLQAFSELQKGRRASDLEERKMAMQEQYYADRAAREESSVAQARRRNDIAMLNMYRQAQSAAAKEFDTMLQADPQLKLDPVRQAALKKQLENKYLQGLMIDSSLGMGGGGGAPSLNPNAADILSE